MHFRFSTMVLNPCLMVLNHFMINLKQISLYSKHLLIGILVFSRNMPAASKKRENQRILWYTCNVTTNLYSKVLILQVNATSDTCSLYKLMLSLLWERNKRFVTAIKPRYQMLFFCKEKTQTSPSYLGFELPTFFISKNLTCCIVSCKDYMCAAIFHFRCS